MRHDVANFIPLIEKKSQFSKNIDIPGTLHQLKIDYEENLELENSDEIRNFVEANLMVVYQLIEKLFPEEQIFTRSWTIKFSKNGSLKAQGKIMVIPIEKVDEAIKSDNKKQRQVMLSQIAHETIHNITDDEALPMLMEIIFLVESNSDERIKDIYDLLTENKLPNQYVVGIRTICEWLKLNNDTFFKKTPNQRA